MIYCLFISVSSLGISIWDKTKKREKKKSFCHSILNKIMESWVENKKGGKKENLLCKREENDEK